MTARVSFGEVVEINPKVALARGIEAPHIEMADLEDVEKVIALLTAFVTSVTEKDEFGVKL